MAETKAPDPPRAVGTEDLLAEIRRLRNENGRLREQLRLEPNAADSAESRLNLLQRAVEQFPGGFVLFDPAGRLVFRNARPAAEDDEAEETASSFDGFLAFAREIGIYREDSASASGWLTDRFRREAEPLQRGVHRTRDGRYLQVEEGKFGAGYIVSCITDVSQLVQAELAMERMLDKSEADSRAKSIFLAHMSHELRTPLNAIIGFAEFMLTDRGMAVTTEKRRQFLEDILFAGRHLNTIIADILDLSRTESGEYRISKRSVDLWESCDKIRRLFDATAAEKGVRISIDIDKDVRPVIFVDARALHQMLINLLANALRHTPAGGRIIISALMMDSDVSISVTDTGSGIPADEIDDVLKPFRRGRNTDDIDDSGVGLGLSLTKELMESHGGRLVLASTEGAGTTVTLEFPDALEISSGPSRLPERVSAYEAD